MLQYNIKGRRCDNIKYQTIMPTVHHHAIAGVYRTSVEYKRLRKTGKHSAINLFSDGRADFFCKIKIDAYFIVNPVRKQTNGYCSATWVLK
jgi:hypothetical protein